MIESSIWVPNDLGSKAIDTPVPKTPLEDAPMQPVSIKKRNIKIEDLFFIF